MSTYIRPPMVDTARACLCYCLPTKTTQRQLFRFDLFLAPREYMYTVRFGLTVCLFVYQDDEAFRRVISLRSRTRLLRWATPAVMRGVGEVAVAEGVSFAEAVRLSVARGQVEGEDASTFIYGLRRCSL